MIKSILNVFENISYQRAILELKGLGYFSEAEKLEKQYKIRFPN